PAEKDMAGVGVELEAQSLLGDDVGAMKVLETRGGIAAEEKRPTVTRDTERLTEGLLDQAAASATGLLGVRARRPDPPLGGRVTIVVDDQGTLVAAAIRVGEDVLVHPPLVGEEIVEPERGGLCKELPAMQQRRDLSVVPCDQLAIGRLLVIGAPVFHSVPLGEALHLSMTEHREPRHRRHQRADAEVLVTPPELIH